DFHLQAPVQATFGGAQDAFVARIDTTATTSDSPGHNSSYLGGSGNDFGTGIATDSQSNAYVAGETASTNFPLASSFQSALNGATDAFVSKITPSTNLAITGSASPSPVGIGNQVTYTFTVTNNGDLVSGVTFTDFLPSSPSNTFTSATTSAGSCGSAS